jgi:hypothetical protein
LIHTTMSYPDGLSVKSKRKGKTKMTTKTYHTR